MRILIEKTAAKPTIRITRDDGVMLEMRPPDRKFSPPHDITHFVVETSLGLKKGFWGTVAAGGIFSSMTVTDGRQRPHAKARSKDLIKANQDSLSEAEAVVGAFQHVLLENSKSYRVEIQRRLGATGRLIDADAIERTWCALKEFRERWDKLAMGDHIVLAWENSGKLK